MCKIKRVNAAPCTSRCNAKECYFHVGLFDASFDVSEPGLRQGSVSGVDESVLILIIHHTGPSGRLSFICLFFLQKPASATSLLSSHQSSSFAASIMYMNVSVLLLLFLLLFHILLSSSFYSSFCSSSFSSSSSSSSFSSHSSSLSSSPSSSSSLSSSSSSSSSSSCYSSSFSPSSSSSSSSSTPPLLPPPSLPPPLPTFCLHLPPPSFPPPPLPPLSLPPLHPLSSRPCTFSASLIQ